jgi:hypothetical protein
MSHRCDIIWKVVMARNDSILDKPDSRDSEEFELLIRKALQAKR